MIYKKSSAVIAFLVMLVLLTGAVGIGAYRGWSEQKEEVEASKDSLYDMLTARREIGNNILSVAKRHLPADHDQIKGLQSDIASLAKDSSFPVLAKANERFEQDAAALLETVKLQSSLQSDERDQMYVEQMLPQALEKSASMTEQAEYNQQAQTFNRNMSKRMTGRIAQLLGIKPAEQFAVMEGAK